MVIHTADDDENGGAKYCSQFKLPDILSSEKDFGGTISPAPFWLCRLCGGRCSRPSA